MRLRPRTVGVTAFVLVIVGLVVAITAVGWQVVLGPDARPLTARTFSSTPQRLARGRYLVEGVAACFHCHSEHDLTDPELPVVEGKKGAGWLLPIPEVGTLYAPNITPDRETGIGTWSDDAIARAIQEGVAADGHALFEVMPYESFRHFDDEDLASVVVYLRSIPPVHNVVPASSLVFPLSILVKTMPRPLGAHGPAPPRTTPAARGQYLVRTVAGCADCHTPADRGTPIPGLEFGGGEVFHDPAHGKTVVSANITQDPSGIQFYDEDVFIEVLHSGQTRGRILSHIMPFENFRNMTDDDLRDIFAYLKTVPPVKHRVSNTDDPTMCPVCGHVHGLGALNVKAK